MSQAKVDKYKEQKKNRDKIMKREKRERILAEVIVCVVVVALIGFFLPEPQAYGSEYLHGRWHCSDRLHVRTECGDRDGNHC